MKFKYSIIVLSVVSLVGLYGLSLFSQPTRISLATIPAYDGQTVVVQGVVTEYRTTTYGSQLITIHDTQNDADPVTLYIEGDVFVEYGDLVEATGTVQQYKEQWEVVVNNPRFITILQKWSNMSFPLWQLAQHPERYQDTNLNVTGIASEPHGSSLFLSDQDGTYSVTVLYDSSCPHQFSKGDTVMVKARFLYDEKKLQFILKATEESHGIWIVER